MSCQNCESENLCEISAKCKDLCFVQIPSLEFEHDGYVPNNIGISNAEHLYDKYVSFKYCLDCGQIQGEWPAKIISGDE